jgi:phospholipid-binding lipoprotein MlaA
MRHQTLFFTGLLGLGALSPAWADTSSELNTQSPNTVETVAEIKSTENYNTSTNFRDSIKELKHIRSQDLKVNANAAQPENIKDPLQPLNRQVYAFNDSLDRNLVRPIAVQYSQKVPVDVRDSYHAFRTNLDEPWNAVNQMIQGRPVRALKTLGRFTLNTVTSLGFADIATPLKLETQNESFGTTLAYYGVPSGPYLVLPFFGPSTFREGFGLAVDAFGRPQTYLDDEGLYWTDQGLRIVDVRTQLLQFDDVLQGDKYAQLRDIYLQRKNFEIAEKRGTEDESLFIDNDEDLDNEEQDVESL